MQYLRIKLSYTLKCIIFIMTYVHWHACQQQTDCLKRIDRQTEKTDRESGWQVQPQQGNRWGWVNSVFLHVRPTVAHLGLKCNNVCLVWWFEEPSIHHRKGSRQAFHDQMTGLLLLYSTAVQAQMLNWTLYLPIHVMPGLHKLMDLQQRNWEKRKDNTYEKATLPDGEVLNFCPSRIWTFRSGRELPPQAFNEINRWRWPFQSQGV